MLPPLVMTELKVTFVPGQKGLVSVEIEMAGTGAATVPMMIALEVAGLPLAHGRLDCTVQVITIPSVIDHEKFADSPALFWTPLTYHR